MQTISGVAFPISQQALNKLNALGQGQFNYLQLVSYKVSNRINTAMLNKATVMR